MNQISVVLGAEFDEALRARLFNVLQSLGAHEAASEGRWVAGSQELEQLTVTIDGQSLLITAETYIGLSISGPAELVRRITSVL